MDILRLKGVSKEYDGKTVLESLDLNVSKSEILALLGPTGCGKSTLLRLIAGLETPSKGEVFIDGALVEGCGISIQPQKRNVGMVFQDTALWPHMTVLDNIKFALKDGEKFLRHIISSLKLAGFESRLPHTLSGGQRQCVAIARALAQKPLLLLLDEPTANLDWRLKEEILDIVRGLRSEFSVSIIYVTHDQVEAFSVADRIAVMSEGRVEQVGSPEELYEKQLSGFVADFIRAPRLTGGGRFGVERL